MIYNSDDDDDTSPTSTNELEQLKSTKRINELKITNYEIKTISHQPPTSDATNK